jgi:hypothetical protein
MIPARSNHLLECWTARRRPVAQANSAWKRESVAAAELVAAQVSLELDATFAPAMKKRVLLVEEWKIVEPTLDAERSQRSL